MYLSFKNAPVNLIPDHHFVNSIHHQYKEWDEKNPQLVTCNKNTKNIIQGSTVPQEVDTDKEVVFTYDVSFKVFFCRTSIFCAPRSSLISMAIITYLYCYGIITGK